MPLVDLSAPIKPDSEEMPEPLRVEIDYLDHAGGAAQIETMFGVPPRLLRDGEGWTTEEFTRFGTHSATHVDAPWHYNSTVEGKPARRIDELPLEWFFSRGVRLTFTGREDGQVIGVDEIKAELDRIGHELKPLDIVLVWTGCDRFYGQLEYLAHGPGVTAEATRWLHEQGVRVMGIDAWGWDRPLYMQAAEAIERDEPGVFWEAHQADLEYSQIERLVNLEALPDSGFQVACFPLRIEGASAAPARVVAMVD
jgi:kynurenine formamidase